MKIDRERWKKEVNRQTEKTNIKIDKERRKRDVKRHKDIPI